MEQVTIFVRGFKIGTDSQIDNSLFFVVEHPIGNS